MGGQVSWLLPAAVLLLVVGLWTTRRTPRTDTVRASLVLWGGWSVVCGLVFSFMQGTFHPYYTIELAPGLAALVGIGGRELWLRRSTATGRAVTAAVLVVTAAWAFVLLDRTPAFAPWVRWAVLAGAVVGVLALVLPAGWRRAGAVVTVALVVAGLAGPAAYAAETVGTAHTGGGVSAGPAVTASGGRGAARTTDRTRAATGDRTGAARQRTGTPAGGFGGGSAQTDPALVTMLRAAGTRWSAATVGSQGAASLELAGAGAVMAIGGFSGSDPAPTLAQFEQYVSAGQIHYFVAAGGARGRGAGGQIAAWVQQHFTATTVGGQAVYDLAAP